MIEKAKTFKLKCLVFSDFKVEFSAATLELIEELQQMVSASSKETYWQLTSQQIKILAFDDLNQGCLVATEVPLSQGKSCQAICTDLRDEQRYCFPWIVITNCVTGSQKIELEGNPLFVPGETDADVYYAITPASTVRSREASTN